MTTTFATTARRAAPALALGAALLALGGAPAPAAAATLIQSCPYTIVAPGTYVLDRDLTCRGGNGITILADDVRLDLGGNTLTGEGVLFSTGVFAVGADANPVITGLRVANGTVTGFFDGVVLLRAPGARLAGVTAGDNIDDGIDVNDSPGARITGNTLAGNGGDGLDVRGCDGCRVAGNRAAGNEDNGFEVTDTTGARVEGNTATGNEDGFDLADADADGNLVRGNTATGNGESGIEVEEGATGNRLEGNRATGNGGDPDDEPGLDLDDENLDGDPPACVNTWRGNRFATDNEGDGPGAGCVR